VATEFQVIKFVYADFKGLWKQKLLADAVMSYQVLRQSSLLSVVFEATGGTLTTYLFKIPAEQTVFVIGNMIHIPARCPKQIKGNAIKC
jgi:hypothetical protein